MNFRKKPSRGGVGRVLSNFIIAVEAVLPIFIIMGVGMLIRRKGMVDEYDVKKMNKTVFTVFFPALMFSNLYGKDVKGALDGRLMGFGVGMVLFIYFLTFLFVIKTEKNHKTRGAKIQAIFRSNFVIMGIAIVSNIFKGQDLTLTAVMITTIVPLYNVLAVVTLEVFRGERPKFVNVIKQLAKNPMLLGALAGIAAVVVGLKLSEIIEDTITSMANVATPMSLLTLGAFFDFKSIKNRKKDIMICVVGRLAVVPLIGITTGILLGFRGMALVTLIAIFASPSAVSSFPMSQQMNSDYELAGDTVVFSSLFSCFTMFLWIFILKSMGLF